MTEILQFGLSAVHYLQEFRTPFFDGLAFLLHNAGHAPFYGLAIGVLVWVFSRPLGVRIGVAFLFSVLTNLLVKEWLNEPRPFWLDPSVAFIHESGGGLPSGHAQQALMFWGLIAITFNKRFLWVWAILLSLLMGLSRIYVGVHFPTDVLGGYLIASILLATYASYADAIERFVMECRHQWILALALSFVLIIVGYCYPSGGLMLACGYFLGFTLGAFLPVKSKKIHGRGRMIAFVLINFGAMLLVYLGMSKLKPPWPINFIVLAFMGFYVTYVAPSLLTSVLSSKDKAALTN